VYATLPLEDPQNTLLAHWAHIAISPDGRLVALRQNSGIRLRSLGGFSDRALEGTDGGQYPVFSPNGKELAFVTLQGIKRVAISGGPVGTVASEAVGHAIAWGEDDYIYFGRSFGSASIWRVPVSGGTPEAVTEVAGNDVVHSCPQLLPGAKALLYTTMGPSAGSEDGRIMAQRLDSRERKVIIDKAISGRYLPTGHLICATNAGAIYARPFNADRLEVTGKPVQVLDNVAIGGWGGGAFLAVSDNGTIIFIKRSDWPYRVFRMTDMNGRTIESRIAVSPSMLAKMGLSGVGTLNISPDGERAVFVNWKAGGTDLWMLDAHIGEPQRFTIDPAEDEYPAWAPDGGAVAYTTNMPGAACRISVKSAESGAAAQGGLPPGCPQNA
jgi:hypothetical protein